MPATGLDWGEFPFVGVELQPVLLDAFPDRRALRSALRLNWVREWDAWGDTVVGVRVAETAADRNRVAGDFVRRLQSLVEEHDPMVWSPDGAGSPPTSPTDGVGSDVEMGDAEDGKEEGIIEWKEFPFVGFELRLLLRDAFPDPPDLRRLLRRPWVREMDSFGDAVVSIREAPDAAAAERAGAAFIAKLRRLLAEQAQPVLPTNQARREELDAEGREIGVGETHGANDCLCDSLIQVAALAGLLPGAVGADVADRRRLSTGVWEALNADRPCGSGEPGPVREMV